MAKIWDEKLNNLSVKLDDLSKKAAEAAGDAKAYHELMQEAIDEKINTAKGNVIRSSIMTSIILMAVGIQVIPEAVFWPKSVFSAVQKSLVRL